MADLVSVIVPVYNVAAYVGKCLASISRQTYLDIEVVVVNDGSTDGSEQICRDFCGQDSRFHLYTKENGGLSSARNYGLEQINGKYVCFIDADDWVKKDYISSLVEGIDGAEIVIAGYVLDDRTIRKRYIPYRQPFLKKSYEGVQKNAIIECLLSNERKRRKEITGTVVPVWKNMYAVKFLRRNNLRFISERAVYAEDFLFNLEAYCLASKIQVIDVAQVVHLINKGSLSQSYRSRYYEMQKELYRRCREVVDAYQEGVFSNSFQSRVPLLIADAVLKESKCSVYRAVKKYKLIYYDAFFAKAQKKGADDCLVWKYKILYRLFKKHRFVICYITARFMYAGEAPYRYFTYLFAMRERKKEGRVQLSSEV